MSTVHEYRVTFTPNVATYAGAHTFGAESFTVLATTREKAISKARRMRRAEEGREAVPGSYRAARIV